MAKVGEQLLMPEEGWRRHDDSDTNIIYIGNWANDIDRNEYKGGMKYSTDEGAVMTFKFYGSKIRLISYIDTSYTSCIKVDIDGIVDGYFSEATNHLYMAIVYEKILSKGYHTVTLTKINPGAMALDAIDIDEDGKLIPYNTITPKRLLKQNNQFYTLKPDQYKNDQFQPLPIIIPTKEDYQTYGFNDLNLLTQNMTVGADTFKPIDKFDKSKPLEIYKSIEK